ncbi:MAG: RNA methyltransferase [Actinobacteria bacterium]|nr:RNA methyltransferase [Actinomycetota bacterium]
MPRTISSRHHDIIKRLKKLGRRTYRDEQHQFIVEGLNLLSEASAASVALNTLVYVDSRTEEKRLVESMFGGGFPSYMINQDLMNSISGAVTAPGILGVLDQLEDSYNKILSGEGSLFIVADQVRDPGNLGALIRIADASGVDGFLMTPGCADYYNPKVVRAAAGSHFHLESARGVDMKTMREDLAGTNAKILGLDPRGETDYLDIDFNGPVALVVGNEAAGVSAENRALLDCTVRIPMPGKAESMNVATAAAVVVFEALRQRRR